MIYNMWHSSQNRYYRCGNRTCPARAMGHAPVVSADVFERVIVSVITDLCAAHAGIHSLLDTARSCIRRDINRRLALCRRKSARLRKLSGIPSTVEAEGNGYRPTRNVTDNIVKRSLEASINENMDEVVVLRHRISSAKQIGCAEGQDFPQMWASLSHLERRQLIRLVIHSVVYDAVHSEAAVYLHPLCAEPVVVSVKRTSGRCR
jgi:hypothetical protein